MALRIPNEGELVHRLALLTPEGRVAFAASCCERMLPNYDAFVIDEGLADSKACRQALDAMWKWTMGQRTSPEDIATLRERCEEVVTEPERFHSCWTGLATNAVSALMDALECCLSGSPQSAANTGILADDSVTEYIYRVDKPMSSSQVQEQGVGFDLWMTEHPLKKEELEKQQADIELLASTEGLTPEIIQRLRRSARNYGIQPFRRGMVKR